MEREDDSFGSDSDLNDSLLRRLLPGNERAKSTDHLLAPGFKTSAFTVDAMIGEGGFGTVYRAITPDHREVALKVLKKPLLRLSATELAYQQNEIEVLMHIKHPSLLELFDHGVLEDGRLYFLMELVDGVRLDDYVRGRRLDALEAIRIVQKIAEVLAHCHGFGILHLDLKPSNIILIDTFTPRVKMLDFGLAQLSEAALASGEVLGAGTLLYLAPEAISRDRGPAGPKTDLYSVGAILYALLAGRPPFAERSLAEIYRAKTNEDPPLLETINPSVPRALSALVASLLARDVRERYASAARLCTHLKELYFAALQGDSQETVALESHDIPFVGRKIELASIEKTFAEIIRSRRSRTLLIEGQAGIGKTRFVAEVLSRVRERGDALIGYGRCRRLGPLVPFAPLREALARLVQATAPLPKETRAAIRRRVEAIDAADRQLLVRLVPEVVDTIIPRTESVAVERPLSDAVIALLSAIADVVPVFFALEDAHWMDEATVEIVRELVAALANTPVFLVLTGRPEHAFSDLEIMPLAPLDARANEELLLALAGSSTNEAIATLKRSNPLVSGGNPLFVTQIVTDFRLAGSDPANECIPPRPLYGELDRSLARLGPELQRVLGIGAMIGRKFRISDLMIPEIADDMTVAAAIAEADHFYLCRCGDECSFLDESVREHFEKTIDPQERLELHRLLAKLLPPESRAHHLYAAGELFAAAETHFTAAAEGSTTDPALAASHFRRAAEIALELPATPERNDLFVRSLHELSKVAWPLGRVSDIIELLDRCVLELRDVDVEQGFILDGAYARLRYAQGDFLAAADHASRCRDVVKANIVGRALFNTGRFGSAATVLAEGCVYAKAEGEHVELSHSSGLLGAALGFVGRFQEAWELVRANQELARTLHDPVRIAASHFHIALLCEAQGRWLEGAQSAAELLATADRRMLRGLYVYLGTIFAGRHQFHLGNLARAELLLSDAINLSSELGTTKALGWAHAFLGDIHFVARELEHAAEHYRRGLELACAGAGDAYAGSLSRIGLAHLEAANRGDPVRAREFADASISQAEASGNRAILPVLLQRWGEVLDAFGDHEDAQRVRAARELIGGALGLTNVNFWPGAGGGYGENAQRRG